MLVGGAGAQRLVGGAGGDRIAGGKGADTLTGGAGADTFVFNNGDGADVITDFQSGVDKLLFQGVALSKIKTTLVSGGLKVSYGADSVVLTGVTNLAPGDIVAGAKPLLGSSGADKLDQSRTSDPAEVTGLAGNDVLKGGSGDDWLDGGKGTDTLTGGAGADSFVFGVGDGADRIEDFTSGVDHLVLRDVDPASVISAWATVSGVSGIRIDYGTAGDSIFLARATTLTPGDLVYATTKSLPSDPTPTDPTPTDPTPTDPTPTDPTPTDPTPTDPTPTDPTPTPTPTPTPAPASTLMPTPPAEAGIAPAVPAATAPGQLVGFALQNTGTTSSAAQYVTFNQQFEPGLLPNGTNVTAVVNGTAVATQMDVTQRYADGSVKAALITLLEPSIAAGGTVQGMLQASGTTPGAALAAGDALNHGYDLAVAMNIAGVGNITINAAQELSKAIANGTAEVIRQGANAVEVQVDVYVTSSLRVTLDITSFADGSNATQVQFNNDRAMTATGGAISFNNIAITQGGQTKFSTGALTQYQYQTWNQEVSSGPSATPTLHVVHDINYLQQIGVVQNYDLRMAGTAGFIASEAAFMADPGNHWTGILGTNGIMQAMPTTGGRPDIGPTTQGNALWLITQDPTAAKFALGQAEVGGSVPWNFYDATKGHYLSVLDYPQMWIDPRGTVVPTQNPGYDPVGGWTPETSHQPDLAYTAYILTGEQYYLDKLNAQASWSIARSWNAMRQDDLGIVANPVEQVRGQAWMLRQIDEAAFANPDGSYEKAYFTQIANNNWSYLASKLSTWTEQQGEVHGWMTGYGTDTNGFIAPWMDDYFATTAAQAALQGIAEARAVLKWEANFLSGRFLSPDMDPHNGYAYHLNNGPGDGTYYKTWAQVQSATTAAGNAWYPGQPPGGNFAEVALESNAALITVFSGGTDPTDHAVAANAMRAFGWLLTSGDPYLRSDPQFQIVPRLRDGTQLSVDEQHVTTETVTGGVQSFAGHNVLIYDNGVGRTTLQAGPGSSVLIDHSTQGGDTLIGGASDDYLIGGIGTNRFTPGAGNDYAMVGRGAALIDVDPTAAGALEVAGFRPGTDHLNLLGAAAGHGADLLASATADAWGNAVLTISGARTVTLVDIHLDQLSTAIFL